MPRDARPVRLLDIASRLRASSHEIVVRSGPWRSKRMAKYNVHTVKTSTNASLLTAALAAKCEGHKAARASTARASRGIVGKSSRALR